MRRDCNSLAWNAQLPQLYSDLVLDNFVKSVKVCASQQNMVTMSTQKPKQPKIAPKTSNKKKVQASVVSLSPKKQPVRAAFSMNSLNFPATRMMDMQTENFEKATQSMMKAYEEINHISREMSQATMQSATALSEGLKEMAQSANGLMQEQYARSVTVGKSMMSAQSVQDAMKMQADFMRDMMDSWMSSGSKMSEMMARISKDVMDPVAQQANSAMSKVMSRMKSVA